MGISHWNTHKDYVARRPSTGGLLKEPMPADPEDFKTQVRHIDSGLPIIVRKVKKAKTTAVVFGTRFGRIDDSQETGTPRSHYLEHVLFEGTQRRKTVQDINDVLNSIARRDNAATYNEATLFYIETDKGADARRAVDLISDQMANSTIRRYGVENERRPVWQEYASDLEDTGEVAYDALMGSLFKGHPVGRPSNYSHRAVNAVTRAELLAAYRDKYTPDNSAVVLYGAVNKELIEAAERKFSSLSGDLRPTEVLPAPLGQSMGEVEIADRHFRQAKLIMAMKVPPMNRASGEREQMALELAVEIAGTRAMDRLRWDRGLAYGAGGWQETGSTYAYVALSTAVAPSNAPEARRIMYRILDGMSSGEITPKEFREEKEDMAEAIKVPNYGVLGGAVNTALNHLVYGKTYLLEQSPKILDEITLDNVRKVASEYLRPDRSLTLLLRPGR